MILGEEEKPPLDELAHFGVKGMKWGVRKTESSAGSEKTSRFTPQQKTRAKQIAIAGGILLAAAGAAYIAKNSGVSMKLPMSHIKPPAASTKKIVDHVLKEQVDVIHASRGKNVGFRFIKQGGLDDALHDYEKAFGADSAARNVFKKLADGRIAAAFDDPLGRADHAGRIIPHQVIIPRSMAGDIHSLDDVKSKIWPKLSDSFDEVYNIRPRYSA